MKDYIHKDYAQCLAANRLNTFDLVWAYQQECFEEPNSRRGGWSGVCRLDLPIEHGMRKVFLKRQENHVSRSLHHPFAGEPTFACEFRMLTYLQKRGVPTPVPVFFGQRIVDGRVRAILMTAELAGYKPLDELADEFFADGNPGISIQRRLLRSVAGTVKALHAAGVEHRALYPKHLFVRWPEQLDPEVAVIDLETSRANPVAVVRTVYDLDRLNRRASHWSRTARMYFFQQYLGVKRLNGWHKLLCRLIIKRSRRKK